MGDTKKGKLWDENNRFCPNILLDDRTYEGVSPFVAIFMKYKMFNLISLFFFRGYNNVSSDRGWSSTNISGTSNCCDIWTSVSEGAVKVISLSFDEPAEFFSCCFYAKPFGCLR